MVPTACVGGGAWRIASGSAGRSGPDRGRELLV